MSRLEYDREWRKNNKNKIRAIQKRYRAKHRVRLLAERRAWYLADPRRKQHDRAWRAANREGARASRRRWALANRLVALIALAKYRARRKGIEFNLTQFDLHIPERCPVFGVELSKTMRKGDLRGPSIDRIIPSKGYVAGNVAVISLRANLLKNNATLEELESLVSWMRKQC